MLEKLTRDELFDIVNKKLGVKAKKIATKQGVELKCDADVELLVTDTIIIIS